MHLRVDTYLLRLKDIIFDIVNSIPYNRVKKIFDQRSEVLDEVEWLRDKELLNVIKNFVDPEDSDRLLDVATGTGALLSYFSCYVQEAHGIDISGKMVAKTQKNVLNSDEACRDNMASITVQDVHNLEFPKNYFDIIVCRNGLHHFIGIKKALMEMRRVLKKSTGKIVIVEGIALNENDVALWRSILELKDPARRNSFATLHSGNYEAFFAQLLIKAGLHYERSRIYCVDRSVKNWLRGINGIRGVKYKHRIMQLLRSAPEEFKMRYNMREKGDDIIMVHPVVMIQARDTLTEEV